MMRYFLIALVAVFGLSYFAEARTWTQAGSGKKIEADLLKVEAGVAHLKLHNGGVGQVDVISLSLEDQKFIAKLEESPAGSTGAGWPAFRGANGDGISPDTGLLEKWPTEGPAKLWVFEEAGMGYSGFSVVGGVLYTMGTQGEDVTVVAVDTATGEKKWSTKIGDDDQKGYSAGWGHGPRSTPTYSDGHIYALGPKGSVACLAADSGSKVWSKHLVDDFGGKAGGWGFAESPLVDGDHLILGPGGDDAGIVALDKKSGKTVWKSDDLKPGKAEYATIIATEIHGKKQYVRLFEKELVGVSAEEGAVLWRSPWEGKTAVIPTPIVDGDEIYVTSGYGVGCKLVKVNSDWSTEDVWINKEMKNHHGGVVKVGDYLYGFSDGAGLICQEWASGEMVWNEKGQFTSKGSVHVADNHLYALNEQDGTLLLVEVSSDGFTQKGQFTLDPQSPNRNPKGKVWTHPLVVDGKLYLRDQEYIVAYDVSGK